MFCPGCFRADPTVRPASDGKLPPTTLPLVLIATLSRAGSHEATISNTRTGNAGLYAVGDKIPAAGAVRWVGAQTLTLWNDTSGRLERIDLVSTNER